MLNKDKIFMDFINIKLGTLIQQQVKENNIDMTRICNFFNLKEEEIKEMYELKTFDSGLLLKWSKLLEYDFFRIYSQHLLLYCEKGKKQYENIDTSLPFFRKRIYMEESIALILKEINEGKNTKKEIIDKYSLSKSTVYRWIRK